MIDVAVLTQDPRFGGGGAALTQAFVGAAGSLGRDVRLFWGVRPGLAGPPGDGLRVPLARIDAIGVGLAARKLAPRLRDARSAWVVAALGHVGVGAALSGRSYACWLASSLESEWAGRRRGLSLSRRAALELNAPVLRRYERRALRGARCVFAISPFSRDRLAEAGDLDPEAIEILPIPVDLRHFTPLDDDDWSARLAQPTLVFVGRADDPRKNAGLLLEAFPAVRERVPHVRLRFVGRPPASPLPDGAVAVGEVQDVAAHLRDAALLVLPSHQEGFGIVAAEALACGVPMVTTPCGGPEALVRISGGGAVLSSFDVEELVETISSLLLNPTCLSAMRRSGRRHVVREHAPERLRDLLESVLDPVHSR